MGFTIAEKKSAAEFAPRYRKAGKSEKSRILDEYLTLSGSKSRKYAIFKLNRIGKTQLRHLDGYAVTVKIVEKSRKKRVYQPWYDQPAAEMLERLWSNFNWPCGKRFATILKQNLDLIRLHNKYEMPDTIADKLKTISPRTIVCKITGCFRYQGAAGVAALQAVYAAYDPLLNLYYPCMKQISGERAGARKNGAMTGVPPSGGSWNSPLRSNVRDTGLSWPLSRSGAPSSGSAERAYGSGGRPSAQFRP